MIATVTPDITAWIIFAVMVGGAVGFMTCALLASGTIRRNREEDFQEGYECCNRDHENAKINSVRTQ